MGVECMALAEPIRLLVVRSLGMFQVVEGEEEVDGAKRKGKGQSMMVPAIVEKGRWGHIFSSDRPGYHLERWYTVAMQSLESAVGYHESCHHASNVESITASLPFPQIHSAPSPVLGQG